MTRPPRRNAEGFTLMEMLVVLVLIALIASVAIPQVMRLLEGAKSKAAKIQLETVSQSLHYYQIDIGRYPNTQQGLTALWTAPAGIDSWAGPYIREPRQIVDPWGNPLIYTIDDTGRKFQLGTLGADGKAGGTGEDADLSAIK